MGTTRLWDTGMSTRDGVRLSADVHLPAGGEPTPAILLRTPYGKNGPVHSEAARAFTRHGWAFVVQDVRGRHDSLGEWVPFVNEFADGADAVEWVGRQPWCDGRVVTWGGSYAGFTQWALAREHPEHLAAMMSSATAGRFAEELPFDRGIPSPVMASWLHLVGGRVQQDPLAVDWATALRHLPLRDLGEAIGRDLPVWREWLEHPGLDDYWQALRPDAHFAGIDVPVLHITGWFDDDQPGALLCWDGMAGHSGQHLVIGPWDHGGTRVPQRHHGGVDFGAVALVDVLEAQARWLASVFYGDEAPAPVRIFLTGGNRWVATHAFPHESGELRLHLAEGFRLSEQPGEGSSSFAYDPADPVPAALDDNVYAPAVETPLDRSFQLDRADVLVWTAEPAAADLTLVGRPWASLDALTDRLDTDWFLALHDVSPSGENLQLATGRMRARFGKGLDAERFVTPGVAQTFAIELSAVGHVLLAGHRLRVSVTSSDFPIFDRNPNTGGPIGSDTDWLVATNTVLHTSSVSLPVTDPALLRDCELPLLETATAAPTL